MEEAEQPRLRITIEPAEKRAVAAAGPADGKDPSDVHLFALELAWKAHELEYSRKWETWKHLDSKAYWSLGISGVLLGAFFQIVLRDDRTAGNWTLALIVLTLLAASAVFLLAVLALRVEEVQEAPSGSLIEEHAQLIADASLEDADSFARVKANFVRDTIPAWHEVGRQHQVVLDRKAKYLEWAQRVLIAQWTTLCGLILMRFFS